MIYVTSRSGISHLPMSFLLNEKAHVYCVVHVVVAGIHGRPCYDGLTADRGHPSHLSTDRAGSKVSLMIETNALLAYYKPSR